MAIQPCKECGKQVSTLAVSCPNCGSPIARPKKAASSLSSCLAVLLLLGFGFFVLVMGCGMVFVGGVVLNEEEISKTMEEMESGYSESVAAPHTLLQNADVPTIEKQIQEAAIRLYGQVKPHIITARQFDRLDRGDSYEETISEFGREGDKTRDTPASGSNLPVKIYQWNNPDGSHAIIVYEGNKLYSKRQSGLK